MFHSKHCRSLFLLMLVFCFNAGIANAQNAELIFSAMGDVPYSSSEEVILQQQIADHNRYSPSAFMVHVGDIKSGGGGCPESVYQKVAGFLLELEVPTFVIPGDNEWTGCSDWDQSWSFWTTHFMSFEQNFCGAPAVERQPVRPENFAWVKNGVLIIGINMPGGTKKNPDLWDARLQDNANWVIQQLQQKASQVRAAVIFAHALKKTQDALFYDQFRPAAAAFAKPILWINGNDHSYKLDHPFPEQNITRVTVDNGGAALPIQVTVKTSGSDLFVINRTPWNSNSQPINRPPCGNGPVIAVNPTSHNFGQVAVGGADSKTFVVSNAGNENLDVTGTSLVGSNPGEFNIDSGGGSFTLAPGATRNVAVSFNPTSEGSKSAVLRFANNDPNRNPLDVNLTGSGIVPQPDIAVNPTSHDFGQVNVGSSDSKLFVVSNTGSLDLNVSATTLLGSDADEFSIDSGGGAFTLAPGANRNVLISFNPTSEGAKSATFRINSNDPDEEPFNVALSGTGAVPGSGPFVFNPTADAYVNNTKPTSNFGTSSTLRVRNSSTILYSFLKFDVSGISGSAQSAKLRLFVTQSSSGGGSVYLVSNNFSGTSNPWTETGLNWNNAPAMSGSALSTIGSVTSGQWVEFDVTPAITGNGTFSFGIKNASSTAAFYSSKEGSNDPELVINGGGEPPPAPLISSFSPGSGPVGTTVTVLGSNFGNASEVAFNGVASSNFNVVSSSEIRAEVPGGAATGKIRVTTPGGTAASSADFTVTSSSQPPSITSFTPTGGPPGTSVTISGSNFSGATEVSFNGAAASFTVASSSEIRAAVPAGASDGPISVTTPGGVAASSTNFDVTAPPPITAFNPTDDAYVRQSNPTSNTGNSSSLRVRKTSSETIISYLKFDVSGLSEPAQSATLRLFVTDASSDGGEVYLVSNNYEGTGTPWLQSGLNWNNAPVISGSPLASVGGVSLNSWVEMDVSAAVSGDGVYSFAIRNNSSDVVYYGSRESANQPQLVITTGSSQAALKFGSSAQTSKAGEFLSHEPLPKAVWLSANFPNPFNLQTTFEYALPEAAQVKLVVYNIRGQHVRTLVDGWEAAGVKMVGWDGRDEFGQEVGSGLYFVRLTTATHVITQKLTLQK